MTLESNPQERRLSSAIFQYCRGAGRKSIMSQREALRISFSVGWRMDTYLLASAFSQVVVVT